jgi:hypothetical protein
MRNHVRILAYLHIVFGSLGVLCGLLVLLIFGGAGRLVGVTSPYDPDTWRVAIPVIGVAGLAICAFFMLLSIPGIIAGVGLLEFRPWARTLAIVLSAPDLLHVPLGTALGIYGLWVLLNAETERLFGIAFQPQVR